MCRLSDILIRRKLTSTDFADYQDLTLPNNNPLAHVRLLMLFLLLRHSEEGTRVMAIL